MNNMPNNSNITKQEVLLQKMIEGNFSVNISLRNPVVKKAVKNLLKRGKIEMKPFLNDKHLIYANTKQSSL